MKSTSSFPIHIQYRAETAALDKRKRKAARNLLLKDKVSCPNANVTDVTAKSKQTRTETTLVASVGMTGRVRVLTSVNRKP